MRVRCSPGNTADAVQMLHVLHIAAIMPTKEWTRQAGDELDHRVFPLRVCQRL